MTEIKYEDGIIIVGQYGVSTIRFRPCDLDYDSRMALMDAVSHVVAVIFDGTIGNLKRQPVEVRQQALEEALGVSFPCGTGE